MADPLVAVEHRHREQDRPQLPGGEEDRGRLRGGREDDRDPVAALDPAVAQQVRGPVGEVLELAPAQLARGAVVALPDHRRLLARVLVADVVGDVVALGHGPGVLRAGLLVGGGHRHLCHRGSFLVGLAGAPTHSDPARRPAPALGAAAGLPRPRAPQLGSGRVPSDLHRAPRQIPARTPDYPVDTIKSGRGTRPEDTAATGPVRARCQRRERWRCFFEQQAGAGRVGRPRRDPRAGPRSGLPPAGAKVCQPCGELATWESAEGRAAGHVHGGDFVGFSAGHAHCATRPTRPTCAGAPTATARSAGSGSSRGPGRGAGSAGSARAAPG